MISRALFPAILGLSLAACWTDDPVPRPPPPVTLTGDLDVDIRDSAHVELVTTGTDLAASLTLTKSFGIAGGALAGAGHVEAFPEAGATLYTARIDAPADPTGPCGAQPISLALSLRRRGNDAHVGGALTAYCGKGVWHGTPARLLRLSGDLQ